ncbi:MAG: adenylosuccinate synthase [Aquificaceae bacterium]|nr:adenylosuccinate synthase [Aquificaceae bacterium]MDW8237649.1 adenylosuccinate synthase [Aquificaceae bacterium]
MKKLVVLGAQWGDEGKGKVVDLLSPEFDMVVRYQGGSNAGHTVIYNQKRLVLHLLPTGVLHKDVKAVISQGVVIDLQLLLEEIKKLEEIGINLTDRLFLSDRAHIVLSYHKALEKILENKDKIGTTLRGIGPTYMFKFARRGIRLCDIKDENRLYSLIEENVNFVKELCREELSDCELSAQEVYEKTLELYQTVKDWVVDVSKVLISSQSVLFEGAQGSLLDIDSGTYPFVTSSNSSALGLTSGTGLPPKYFCDAKFWGVFKAYLTRVGAGPFPTELNSQEGELLRKIGDEFGSTTGRPRRCGWIDLVALKHVIETNGIDALVMTKLDVLDTFERLKVCVAYRLDGKIIEHFPPDIMTLQRVEPVFEELPGWQTSTRGTRSINDMPDKALEFISFIEEQVNTPIVMLSTGPSREEYILL